MVVGAYSLISMFSMINCTYVRDFDALQVNITPLLLAVSCLVSALEHHSVSAIGMAVATGFDAYFGLRYRDNTDVIEFNVLERFALENWVNTGFRENNLTQNLAATFLIFSELYFGAVGVFEGHTLLSSIFIAFSMLRLSQLFLPSSNMIALPQSNFMAVALTGVTCYEAISTNSILLGLASGVLGIDAFLGSAIFFNNNR